MAKFCKYCGTQLEEGQVCSCPKAQAELAAPSAAPAPEAAAPVATAAPAAAPAAGNGFVKKLLDVLKGYWKAPKEAAAAVAEDKQGMAVAGVFAGVNFLAIFFFLWRIIGMVMSTFTGDSDVDMDELMEYLEIELPIFPMLLAGLAIAAIGIAATALVIFIAAKINKQAVDLKKQIVIEAVHSVIPTALLVVGILLGFLAAWLQFIVLALILVLWFVNVCNEIREVAGVQVMETGKSLTLYTLVIFVALAIIVWLMTAIGGWGVGELSIEGHTVNEAMEEADNMLGMLGDLF